MKSKYDYLNKYNSLSQEDKMKIKVNELYENGIILNALNRTNIKTVEDLIECNILDFINSLSYKDIQSARELASIIHKIGLTLKCEEYELPDEIKKEKIGEYLLEETEIDNFLIKALYEKGIYTIEDYYKIPKSENIFEGLPYKLNKNIKISLSQRISSYLKCKEIEPVVMKKNNPKRISIEGKEIIRLKEKNKELTNYLCILKKDIDSQTEILTLLTICEDKLKQVKEIENNYEQILALVEEEKQKIKKLESEIQLKYKK